MLQNFKKTRIRQQSPDTRQIIVTVPPASSRKSFQPKTGRASTAGALPMPSKGDVRAVLELNAGVTRLLGIRPGDKVEHPIFTSK